MSRIDVQTAQMFTNQINLNYGELISANSVAWSMDLLFRFRMRLEDCNME